MVGLDLFFYCDFYYGMLLVLLFWVGCVLLWFGLAVLLVCGLEVVLDWISLDVWVVFCCGVLGVNLYILFLCY